MGTLSAADARAEVIARRIDERLRAEGLALLPVVRKVVCGVLADSSPDPDEASRAEMIMKAIDRHIGEWKLGHYEPPAPEKDKTWNSVRNSLVVEIAGVIESWPDLRFLDTAEGSPVVAVLGPSDYRVLPEHEGHEMQKSCAPWCPRRIVIEAILDEQCGRVTIPLVPDHQGHDNERYCTSTCPRGQWVGHLLEHDRALLPFINQVRNRLSGPDKDRLPDHTWNSYGTLELPRWQMAALYGLLSGTEQSSWPDWLAGFVDELRTEIQR